MKLLLPALPQVVAVDVAVIKLPAKDSIRNEKESPLLNASDQCCLGQNKLSISKAQSSSPVSSTLQALTSAALVLPGLILSSAKAEYENVVGFQYSHYQEGKRNLFNVPNNLQPIEVDTFYLRSSLSLKDRIKFAFNYTQDTWSGATPITTAPLVTGGNSPVEIDSSSGPITVGASPLINTKMLLDSDYNPLEAESLTIQPQIVQILSFASPETRKQGDFNLSYEWDEALLDVSGGLSQENDYQSAYGGLSGRWDFNQKLTSVNMGLSYTHSTISAILDHDAAPYITKTAFEDQIERRGGSEIVNGTRQDWSTSIGLTQILSKNSQLDTSFGYTHSSGYLSNPYKVMTVIFVDPESKSADPGVPILGDVRALMDQRPDRRNQFNIGAHYVHYVDQLNAAMHLNYRFSHDDWDINAHTFELDWIQPLGKGWSITPRIRYYSQSAANFYYPFLVSDQSFSTNAVDENGREIWVDADDPDDGNVYFRDENFNLVDQDGNIADESMLNVKNQTVPFDANNLPNNFSSDYRLAGYGALSGGFTISKEFARGVNLSFGFEYYTHSGSLKLGGGGAGEYADFNYYVANAALDVDISSLDQGGGHSAHNMHHEHGALAPSGVMNSHMLPIADQFMVGYRFMWGHRGGDILHGTGTASDYEIVNSGCSETVQCRFAPPYMNMSMHMVDLMYAPTDWMNLMLMFQFVDKEMNLRELQGRPPPNPDTHEHTGIGGHATGGLGDTVVTSLFKLFDIPGHNMHLGIGISAPTGDVDLQFRRIAQQNGGFVHYGMQLGSGTWDLVPSLTYTGKKDKWSWGAQLSGVTRLQDKNESGYRLGDIFQSTVWGGYSLTHWLSTSVRGIFTAQDSIKGSFNDFNVQSGPMDFPQNYGGHYWDMGFGFNITVPSGAFQGNNLSFEWIQPIQDDVNGYQLERKGSLSASWNYAF